MFLHDIGKPDCYIRRYSKQYGRDVDSFFNHNKRSAEISKEALADFGFSKEDIRQMVMLIYKHDIFMFISLNETSNKFHKQLSQEIIDQEIHEFEKVGNGENLLKCLILMGRADNKAQNPEMTDESLRLLSVMEEMV